MREASEPVDRLIIGISGASGVQYGVRALELLRDLPIETHLVMSKSAELTVHHELDQSVDEIRALADVYHPVRNVGASVASGSFRTRGMLLAPCSIRTLGEITSGVTSSLLTRAADVVLKERRRLVLMVRETPLHLGHLRNMAAVTEMGAIVSPPYPPSTRNLTRWKRSLPRALRARWTFSIFRSQERIAGPSRDPFH